MLYSVLIYLVAEYSINYLSYYVYAVIIITHINTILLFINNIHYHFLSSNYLFRLFYTESNKQIPQKIHFNLAFVPILE